MKAIIGIGNPGDKYQLTRHNIGYIFLDYLADKFGLKFSQSLFSYQEARGRLGDASFVLIKPTTFVNLSGVAVAQVMENLSLVPDDVLIVYDDINLEEGLFKIRKSGGDGGHNGIKSIIYHLNSQNFSRLRIGVGNRFKSGEMVRFVLSSFDYEAMKRVEPVLETSLDMVKAFIEIGEKAMYDINSRLNNTNTKPPK
ncbi:MAG: aminoacyl-tRNA hydrolase [Ignavibacteriaceae bacterium]|nr:aminoacyl-tRNA hydrolase [Ignavibacteriaceae bacterium]